MIEQSRKNPRIWYPGGPKSTKMVPRSAAEATLEPWRQTSDCQTIVLDVFWCHLGDFGCDFGPDWAPRGLQNQPCEVIIKAREKGDVSFVPKIFKRKKKAGPTPWDAFQFVVPIKKGTVIPPNQEVLTQQVGGKTKM